MRLIEADARMGAGGKALALLAVALVTTGLIAPPAGGAVLVQWGASLVLTICLCRVAMPAVLRAGLIAAMLGVAIGDAAAADPIGATATQTRVAREVESVQTERAAALAGSRGQTSAVRGTRVAIEGDWGHRIGGPIDGTLGGPPAAALSVAGTAVETEGGGGRPRVAITWSIARGGVRVPCGTTTIVGPSEAAIVAAARASIARAVEASAAREAATCG